MQLVFPYKVEVHTVLQQQYPGIVLPVMKFNSISMVLIVHCFS